MSKAATYNNSSGLEFWGDQGAGILPFASLTRRFLVGLRSTRVNEPNTWNHFGGALDGAEKPEDAAIREMSEELGYDGCIELVPAFVFKEDSFIFFNYIGIIEEEFNPNLGWETSETQWVSLEELIELPEKHFGLKGLLANSMSIMQSL